MTQKETEPGRNVKCLSCGKYTEREKTFVCRKCRGAPFCLEHQDGELKICQGCAAEKRMRLLTDLLRQERHTKSFLQLSRFIFLIAALFFVSSRYVSDMVPEFLRGNIIFEYAYAWGAAALAGVLFCHIIIMTYRSKMADIEGKIEKHKVSTRYVFR